MIRTTVAIAGFVVAMLIAPVPGYCGNSTGQDPHRGVVATKPAPVGRIETINLAAAGLMRQVVKATE